MQLAVASPRASALDAVAEASVRFAPGAGAAFAVALAAALAGEEQLDALAADAGADAEQLLRLAALLQGAPHDPAAARGSAGESEGPPERREVVVVWGERLTAGRGGASAARALLRVARALKLADVAGAGLLELPAAANGRGLREAGVLPNAGPGYTELDGEPGRDVAAIAEGLAGGELAALYLLHSDPLRDLPDGDRWREAMRAAGGVIAHAAFLTEAVREHADVVFPAETYAEKEGTVVHPDGRLQRLRPAIAHPGSVRAEWRVLVELAQRVGLDARAASGSMASAELFAAVPFYADLTLEEISGRGVRWQERDAAAAFPHVREEVDLEAHETLTVSDSKLDSYRSLWDAPEVLHSPSLAFLHPEAAETERPASMPPAPRADEPVEAGR
jgi:NADH-quinone oxidoreductase subunit G